jgi:hypothetical protein
MPKHAWQKLSAGRAAKGQRFYDCGHRVADPVPDHRHLLIRRNRATAELAHHRCRRTTR